MVKGQAGRDELAGAKEAVLAKCLQSPQRDLLRDVMSYNDSMTISQVIKFFERQGVAFTKSMIQHYVRVGVLPPPEDKRRYSRLHLLMLAILEQLKSIYSLEEIAAAFSGLTQSDGLIQGFQSLADYAVSAWRGTLEGLVLEAGEAARSLAGGEEARKLFESFVAMAVMAQSAAAGQVAQTLIGGGADG